MIYHIYWGTAGNAGLYLDEIYQSLNKAGYEQKAFVSYYYPFDYGEKVFFRRTEMEHCRCGGGQRKMLQAWELMVALLLILRKAKKDKPTVVNYSYASHGAAPILWFLKRLKIISGCKLVITCHDVVPNANPQRAYEKEMKIKERIYALADYYLIHNDNSKQDLMRLFRVDEQQILQHPFPLMDLSKLDRSDKESNAKYDFMLIGHMRREKGVDLLVDAWKKFHGKYPQSTLCLAGNPAYFKNYLREREDWCKENDVDLKLGFVRDEDYAKMVESARCVVFPYTSGTNSGVISTVVSLGRDVITSDIGMFKANPFVPRENMFESGNVDALVEKLEGYINGEIAADGGMKVAEYRAMFDSEVRKVYSLIDK